MRVHGERLHHVSTDEVYGELDLGSDLKFAPTSPIKPSSPYSATKAGSDLLVTAWARSFNVHATISHSSNNFGPRQHIEKFIPRQVANILRGRRPQLYGDGRNVRDWIHVDDHSSAVLAILTRGTIGATCMVGADNQRSNREVVQPILREMGHAPDAFDVVSDRPGHDLRYAVDASRTRAELGWNPSHTEFVEGLRSTIRWYRENESSWAADKDVTERAYSNEKPIESPIETTAR